MSIVNTFVTTDALAHSVARLSVTKALTMQYKWTFVFHGDSLQPPEPSQSQEINDGTNTSAYLWK